MSNATRPGGLQAAFGGTFNPIHFGHLRSARELVDRLPIACLRLIPARVPPHRAPPRVTAEHRAAMVELALAGDERLACDRRELNRDGPSYTVDTLASLRDEFGAEQPLAWIVGVDAAAGLAGWDRWRELFDLAHLIVLARPGAQLPTSGEAAQALQARSCDERTLLVEPAGGVWRCELTPQPISSTRIRGLLQSGSDVSGLLPDTVSAYIARHALYGSGADDGRQTTQHQQ